MLRTAILSAIAVTAISVSAGAEERRPVQSAADAAQEAALKRDGFAISSDACGASRFADLVGRDYAEVYNASLLPADSILQSRNMLRTLEYTPHRLNVSVNGEGRIIAVGCF